MKDEATGEIIEVHCTYDPETKSGMPNAARKVKGTIHWVSAAYALPAEVRLYDHLFTKEHPDKGDEEENWLDHINPNSLNVLTDSRVEPSLGDVAAGDRFQFERQGYYCVDADSMPNRLVFNRTVTLRDTWSKIQKKN